MAIITLINLTFQLGTLSVTDWISNWPLLMDAEAHSHDGGFGPLQALEISYLVGQSRWIWLFAMDMLLLSIGWSAVTFLIFSARRELESRRISPSPSSRLSARSSASRASSWTSRESFLRSIGSR